MLHVGEREFAMLAVAAANATQANNVDNQVNSLFWLVLLGSGCLK